MRQDMANMRQDMDAKLNMLLGHYNIALPGGN